MNLFKKINWRLSLFYKLVKNVRRNGNGLMYRKCFDQKIYIRGARDYVSEEVISSVCQQVYFKKYLPVKNDVVVDFGFGLGHEYAWLNHKSSGVKVIGVEIQPIIYELACNSFGKMGNYSFENRFLSNDVERILISSSSNYTTVGATELGYIPVYSIAAKNFWEINNISNVNLLKMNIEGAEVYVLPLVLDSINVERIIVSAHDFRADRGEGESYRTREKIISILNQRNYKCESIAKSGKLRDWIYAEKENDKY